MSLIGTGRFPSPSNTYAGSTQRSSAIRFAGDNTDSFSSQERTDEPASGIWGAIKRFVHSVSQAIQSLIMGMVNAVKSLFSQNPPQQRTQTPPPTEHTQTPSPAAENPPSEHERQQRIERQGRELLTAVKNGNVAQIEATLAQIVNPQELQAVFQYTNFDYEEPSLHYAAMVGDKAVLRALLKALPLKEPEICKAIVNQKDSIGLSPLSMAITIDIREDCNLDKIQALLAYGAQVSNGHIGNAAYDASPGVLGALLHAVPDPEVRREFVNQQSVLAPPPLEIFNTLQGVFQNLNSPNIDHNSPRYRSLLERAGILLAHGAKPLEISDALRADVVHHLNQKRDEHVTTLVTSNDPSAVRSAMRWFQQFPRDGGELNWQQADELRRADQKAILQDAQATQERKAAARQWLQDYQTPTQKCNAFLDAKLTELKQLGDNPAGKEQKDAILNRVWPILLSGIPCDPKKLDTWGEVGVELNKKVFFEDALQAGAKGHAIVRELAERGQKQQRQRAQAS